MKHGKKPTAAQRRLMEKRGLDRRVIPKGGDPGCRTES